MKQEQQHACSLQPTGAETEQRRSTRPGAIRMSRLRERRERGFCVYQVEVCAADLDALISRGFLDGLKRDDPTEVERSIGRLLDRLRMTRQLYSPSQIRTTRDNNKNRNKRND